MIGHKAFRRALANLNEQQREKVMDFINSLAALQKAATPVSVLKWHTSCVNNIPIEREDTMQNICLEVNARSAPPVQDTDAQKRSYLENRLDRLQFQKIDELFKLFGLADDEVPKTYAEMKARFAAGKFTLPKDRNVDELYDDYEDDCDFCGTSLYQLRWRDPAKYADKKGKAAAEKELNKAYCTAKDTIKVSDLAAGLAALQAFEAWQTTIVPVTVAPATTS